MLTILTSGLEDKDNNDDDNNNDNILIHKVKLTATHVEYNKTR